MLYFFTIAHCFLPITYEIYCRWLTMDFVDSSMTLRKSKQNLIPQCFCMEQTVRTKEEQNLEKTEMRMLRRIKGVTLRDRVKSVD